MCKGEKFLVPQAPSEVLEPIFLIFTQKIPNFLNKIAKKARIEVKFTKKFKFFEKFSKFCTENNRKNFSRPIIVAENHKKSFPAQNRLSKNPKILI